MYFGKGIFRTLVYSEPEAYSEHCQTSTMEKKSFYIFWYFVKCNFLALVLWKLFLYFRKWKPRKKFLIFQQKGLSYISENRNFKKLLIFQKVIFWDRKRKRKKSEKTPCISGNWKISCTLELLLILFAEREVFIHKYEITFYNCPQVVLSAKAVLNLDFMSSSLFFFYFDWL